jgi:protein SCO1/2
MKRRLALALFAGAALRAWAHERDPRTAAELMDALMWGRETPGGHFSLIDQEGRPRTDADFRGRYLLVMFGFTNCSDVCPAQLHEATQLLALLGPDAARIQPVFITLDPERDTPRRLATYLRAFHPSIVGLTGSARAIRKVADAYLVSYRKVRTKDGGYGIDHASFALLMSPEGRYLGFMPPGTDARRMADVVLPLFTSRGEAASLPAPAARSSLRKVGHSK